MSARKGFSDFFRDLGNGVAKAIDIAIGAESTPFTDKLNGAIGDMEESFNNVGSNSYGYGYGQQPYIQQNGYTYNNPNAAPNMGYPGQQQYGYQGGMQNGSGYPPNGSPYGQAGGYASNGQSPNVQYGGNTNSYQYGPSRQQTDPYQEPQPQYGSTGRCVPPDALLSDNSPITRYVTVSGNKAGRSTSFELPPEFVEMNTGSGAEMLYMYRADDGDFRSPKLIKPYICIIPAGGGIPLEKDCTAACIGLMEIRSNGWVNYRGKAARYYGFTRRDDSRCLLALFCEPNVVGTPLGSKMTIVLDHAAETYREG